MKITIEDDEWVNRQDACSAIRANYGIKFSPARMPMDWYEHRTDGAGKRFRRIMVRFGSFRDAVLRWRDELDARPSRKTTSKSHDVAADHERRLRALEAALEKALRWARDNDAMLYP